MESRRLLIMACSQRKRTDPGLLPAVERYDGPTFQVLRKFLRGFPLESQTLDTYILSAKFGLITADKLIPNYDFRMTPKRAQRLHPQTIKSFQRILCDKPYGKLFINLGEDYLRTLDGHEDIIPASTKVTVATGSLGHRQAELRTWLHNGLPEYGSDFKVSGKASIRGIEITLTPEEIFGKARKYLTETPPAHSESFYSWYVAIDSKRVSPKWLVSQLTGLPVSAFHSSDARRALQQLGVEVKRI